MNQKYFIEDSVGNNIFDILDCASHVLVEDQWRPILGYDDTDDVLCAENWSNPDQDFTIHEASKILTYRDFKVSSQVKKRC